MDAKMEEEFASMEEVFVHLIETNISGTPQYYFDTDPDKEIFLTEDPQEAKRFITKEDAEALIKSRHLRQLGCEATEHGFIGPKFEVDICEDCIDDCENIDGHGSRCTRKSSQEPEPDH